MQNSRVQTFLTQILANQLSNQINSKITIGKVNVAFFNKVILQDLLLEGQNKDTLFYTQHVTASIDTLKIKKRKIYISQLTFKTSNINVDRDSADQFSFSYILDSLKTRKDTVQKLWNINCNNFDFQEASIRFRDFKVQKTNTFLINNFNFNITDFAQRQDSTKFNINKLSLDDGKRLYVNDLKAKFIYIGNKIAINDLNLKTNRSEINNTSVEIEIPRKGSVSTKNNFDIQFSNSKISFYEIAELVPSLKGMDQLINISGQVYGNINDLKGKNLEIKTGKNTSANLDFYINGLKNPETMYLFVDLKESETSFTDLNQIKLPQSMSFRNFNFPVSFYEAGAITYKGNFSGFLSDFVAFGTFSSQMGILTTDVSIIPNAQGNLIYRGRVNTQDFNLGELFRNKHLGTVSFNGNVDGSFNKNQNTVNGKFNGEIAKIEINRYEYNNIVLNGTLDNKMFDGLLSINDPNLQFDFSGKVNLNPAIPIFDFDLLLKKALPGKLNLSINFPASEMAFNMNANFKGNKLDNLEGAITLKNGIYKNRNGELQLKDMELRSLPSDSMSILNFNSDFFDVDIIGNYHFQSLLNAFEKNTNHYLPATNYNKLSNAKDNQFEYQINVKDLDELTKVFIPDYQIETPFLLYGTLDSENAVFKLEGSIPGIGSKNIWLKDIYIGNKPRGDEYSSKFRFGEVVWRNGLKLHNLTIDSKIFDNTIDNQITWTNFSNLTYSGSVKTHTTFSENDSTSHPHIEIEGMASKIFIADSIWQIDPFIATIDSSTIEINNFKFFNERQQINLNGKIGKDSSDILYTHFENINLHQMGVYLNKDFNLKGVLNGRTAIEDFYGQRLIYSDLGISDFEYKDQQIGDISIVNQWNTEQSVLGSELSVTKNNRKSLKAEGFYNPNTNQFNYDATVDNLSLIIMETVMRKNFSNFHGDASGKVKIHGTPDRILLNGGLYGLNAGLTIDYTQVSYFFSDTVYFRGDTIDFDNITISDVRKNKGTFDGTIVHENFKNMKYNLSVKSPKIMAMNTKPNINEQFFGQVIANGQLFITGQGKKVNLNGTGTTLSGTNVNISLDSEGEIEQYDFIEFVTTEETERPTFEFPQQKEEDFNLNLTIRATPDAKAQLIYNSQIGDVIKAQGEGLLKFGMDNQGVITLSGNYTVDKGDYLFTLENVINKRFSIEQGGSLVWSGDPYNANIDINAVYKLKASLYDLLVNSYENIYQNQRIPVECKIKLTEELSNPDIQFEIDFPTVEDRIKDQLQQFLNSEEEMNKQILSLLVLGKFYTPEYMRGTYEAQNPNVIGTTASELFSNQLSNWLSQISNNVDIGLNYRPGSQISNDEIELALSTQLFNDRVTLNGNIGNNVNPNSTNNSQLVGDFDVNVKLIPSGKIQLKAYNRSNDNLIYETAPYTQGVGFTIKEEYNTFNELLQKMAALFKRKKSSGE